MGLWVSLVKKAAASEEVRVENVGQPRFSHPVCSSLIHPVIYQNPNWGGFTFVLPRLKTCTYLAMYLSFAPTLRAVMGPSS